MEPVSIRHFCEEDAQVIYDNYCALMSRTVAYYLHGASPYPRFEDFKRRLEKMCNQSSFPFVVVDQADSPIGIAYISRLDRRCKFHDLAVYMWAHPECTEFVLRNVLEMAFKGSAQMAVCRFPGYQQELLRAVRNIGMHKAGCIENYVFCRINDSLPDIWPEYTFVLRRQDWDDHPKGGD